MEEFFKNEENIKAANLTPEQITALTPKMADYVSEQKKQWDGKANTDAEAILSGAAAYLQEKTGVKEDRQQGEKFGDYFSRISDKAIESKKSEVDRLKADYETKLKDFKGDEATKAELDDAKKKLDDAQKLLANYDELKTKAEKYDTASGELSEYKKKVAYSSVKPSFSKDANEYEVKAKWKAFQDATELKYTIEQEGDEYIAIDKENQHKKVKLSDLVAASEDLKALMGEKKVPGLGSKGAKLTVEGMNVEMTDEVKKDSTARTKAVREQLAKEGITLTSPTYAKRFAELNKKILDAK
jgi:hypothetical protein